MRRKSGMSLENGQGSGVWRRGDLGDPPPLELIEASEYSMEKGAFRGITP
jgi:hypothetical protein